MKIIHKKFRKQNLTKEALQNIYLKDNQCNFYWHSAFVIYKTLLKYSCLFHFLSNPREGIFCLLLKRNWSWERFCPHSWNQKNKRTEASPEVRPACLDLLLAVEFWHPACLLGAFSPCGWSPVGHLCVVLVGFPGSRQRLRRGFWSMGFIEGMLLGQRE